MTTPWISSLLGEIYLGFAGTDAQSDTIQSQIEDMGSGDE